MISKDSAAEGKTLEMIAWWYIASDTFKTEQDAVDMWTCVFMVFVSLDIPGLGLISTVC